MHVDLHVGFPARAAQADSFSAARTPRVLALLHSTYLCNEGRPYQKEVTKTPPQLMTRLKICSTSP